MSTEEIKNSENDFDLNKTKASFPINWEQEKGSFDLPGGVWGRKNENTPNTKDNSKANWKMVALSPHPYQPTTFTITIQAMVPNTRIGGNSISGFAICLIAMEVVNDIAGVKVKQ